ncbi:MAG: dihydroorotase [Bacteriovoracaceae bacterium]
MTDFLLKNAKAFINNDFVAQDIRIQNDKIAEIGPDLEVNQSTVIDCTEKIIIPGIIDSQVHFRDPGLTHKEDLETGSKSAAMGGVTTFCEMPNTKPSTTTKERILEKVEIANKKSVVNFHFFMGATDDNLEELKKVDEIPNCCGIKIFLGSSTGDLLVDHPEILKKIFKETTAPIAVHSENETRLKERLPIRDKATSAIDHPNWRDVETAFSSTRKIIELARECKRKIHVLHITTQEEIEFLAKNKDTCTVEVTPQHLTLSSPDCYEKLGTYAQMNPPVREKRHTDALWEGIHNGTVDIIGSDHAPHTKEEKDKGYPHSPSGMPGVQTILLVMLKHLEEDKITWPKLIELLVTNPAKKYSLDQERGSIETGKAADLVVLDPQAGYEITDSAMQSRCGWTPFHGMTLKHRVSEVFCNGKQVVKEGKENW